MGIETAAIIGGTALLGGIAGGKKDKSSSTSTNSSVSEVITDVATQQEKEARDLANKQITDLDARLRSIESSPTLANLDRLLGELGQAPSAERIQQAQSFTKDVFAQQEQSLQQAFQDQQVSFAQRAAQMGRSSSDPILAAKLAQEQIRQRSQLDAAKTSFAAQESINAPLRQFQNQLAGVGGLSQQAIQNRQAIFGMGSDFANTLMNYRLATATRTGTQTGTTQTESGGGLKGIITGALGGASAGLGAAQGLGMFGASSPPPMSQVPTTYNNGYTVGQANNMGMPSSGFSFYGR